MNFTPNNILAPACIIPTVDATSKERAAYLQCRALSLAYQAQELSTALVREHFDDEASEIRAIVIALRKTATGIGHAAQLSSN